MSTFFTGLIVPGRGTKIPMQGWVAVPIGWPAPTAPVVLRSASGLGNIKTAYADVDAGQPMGLYDWYPVDFGEVRIQDSRWALILQPGPHYNEYMALVAGTTTNWNGDESFTYNFRFFRNTSERDCFASNISNGLTLDQATYGPTSCFSSSHGQVITD